MNLLPLLLAYAGTLFWAVWMKVLPWWVIAAWLGVNLLTFFLYRKDKHAAESRQWRVRESTLHLWSLLGGWAGARVAQQVLRHKSRKASFLRVYWFTVVAHCAAAGWWLHLASG